MAAENFEVCLKITLKWEGGYSNHPDDPGGPTMKGIIQREYDAWRKKNGKSKRPVRQIEESELQAIYRTEYWDAMDCESLPLGVDLCVFDAAVNSGVGRARRWQQMPGVPGQDFIDTYCDARLAFLKRLGRLWRVFGPGWARRVAGIRARAHGMASNLGEPNVAPVGELHAGMRGPRVEALQIALRKLGYPIGNVDGTYGEQVYRAVVLFQHDHELQGEPGIWLPEYDKVLATAAPVLPQRQDQTHKDLEERGDRPTQSLGLLQRVFAWVFGASAVAQVVNADSVLNTVGAVRQIVDPLQDIFTWVHGNKFLIFMVIAACLIALVRFIRAGHVEAYRNMTYQGPEPSDAKPLVPVDQGV